MPLILLRSSTYPKSCDTYALMLDHAQFVPSSGLASRAEFLGYFVGFGFPKRHGKTNNGAVPWPTPRLPFVEEALLTQQVEIGVPGLGDSGLCFLANRKHRESLISGWLERQRPLPRQR